MRHGDGRKILTLKLIMQRKQKKSRKKHFSKCFPLLCCVRELRVGDEVKNANFLMNTSIISFLMLIAFSAGEKGLKAGRLKGSGLFRARIPSRLQSNNITFRSYILNGTPADIRDYPFKLSLRLFGELACSASVIAPRWALTAAHCLEMNLPPELITLYGGSSNRITGGVEFAVEEYILHPDYNLTTLDCDVGVIKIKNSFVGHRNIWPSVLANEACNTTTGMTVCLAGWGMNEDFEFPEELHEIQQTILDQDECYNLWGGDITNRMLCGAVENGVDSCIGCSQAVQF
ncbi:CLUMA_CG012938, isoform A [Clunio marinus]|uniref:CLUMA_CG012938, isoform A n=1 Tax=Clunio marinus TaxID=568069 RepID=A0A1J1IIM8_9DIPT|nr:CLUMA_CG012938, isoform A [Clunio marinus]